VLERLLFRTSDEPSAADPREVPPGLGARATDVEELRGA